MHYMWPYDGGFYDLTDRPMRAQEWSDALAQALARKDAAGARRLFDHTFWHGTDFKPDWFHLYIAVQQQDRELVQMMVTYGARWNPQQTAIAAETLKDRIAPFKSILAQGGMRIDAAPRTIDPIAALEMDRRIMDENAKFGGAKPEDVKKFNLAVGELCLRAAERGDAMLAKKIYMHHTEFAQGLDIAPVLCARAHAAPHSFATNVITAVDALKAAGVPLKPLAFETLPRFISGGFYELVPALEERGMLAGDLALIRGEMWRSWSYTQEQLAAPLDNLSLAPEVVRQMRAQFTAAAKVLCHADSDISAKEVESFIALHTQEARRHPDSVAHMDETLLAEGFFGNPAFDAASLKQLAQDAPSMALRDAFAGAARKRDIEDRGIGHFLNKKRFPQLLEAVEKRDYKLTAQNTREVVRYLYDRCGSRDVPNEVMAALQVLKTVEADFRFVDPVGLIGSKHPLLAKTLLDLDLVKPKDFKLPRLFKKIPPHKGYGALFAKEGARDYDLREFLYQVMYERAYPALAADARAKSGTCYQRLYMWARVKTEMEKIKTPRPPSARTSGISPPPPPAPPPPRYGPKPGY